MGIADSFAAVREARDRRTQMRADAETRNQELQKMGYSFEDGQMRVRPDSMAEAEQSQAKQAAQLARALQGKLAAQDTDRAFEDFAHTGDANYLQSALDNNPELKTAWGSRGVQMVSNIDFENDKSLLDRYGLSDTHYDTPEKQSVIRKNAYKIYNGKEWGIGLANTAVAETGALQRMGQRRGGLITKNFEELTGMLNGPKVSPFTAEGHKYGAEIMEAANTYNLPPNLIAAQMHQESRGKKDAVSSKGATGLMQLMPDTAKELGVTDITDPKQNIMGGAKYLRQMLDKYDGDTKLALAAYNAGPGNVDKYGGIPPFAETQDYVNKVLGNLDQGESYYGGSADKTIETILNHQRAVANAAKGTTNENVDQSVKNETVNAQANSDTVKINAAKAVLDHSDNKRSMDQKDTELGLKGQELLVKLKTEGTTTKQKDLDAAETEMTALQDQFGGEDAFFSADLSDQKTYNKAMRSVIKIEQLTNTAPSEADKKTITDVRQLIALGDPAKELTGSETGLLDSTLGDMEKYFQDNVKGTEAKSSYNAFRNSVRNALFGSALTEAEIKSFNDAYGTLGQKLGPVLEMFQTSLNQVNAKLNSTADLMNPYSAKVRLGADQARLQKIQGALQERINYIKGIQNPELAAKSTEEKQAGLDTIFKGK